MWSSSILLNGLKTISYQLILHNVICSGVEIGIDDFGRGRGTIWLDDVDCTGWESRIEDCWHAGWGSGDEDCNHEEDVGIRCVDSMYKMIKSNIMVLF